MKRRKSKNGRERQKTKEQIKRCKRDREVKEERKKEKEFRVRVLSEVHISFDSSIK